MEWFPLIGKRLNIERMRSSFEVCENFGRSPTVRSLLQGFFLRMPSVYKSIQVQEDH